MTKLITLLNISSEFITKYHYYKNYIDTNGNLLQGVHKKYEILEDDTIVYEGYKLYRVRALIDFARVKAGDIGGYISREEDLMPYIKFHSQRFKACKEDNSSWLDKDSKIINGYVGHNSQLINSTIIGSFITTEYSTKKTIVKDSIIENSEICGSKIYSSQIDKSSFWDENINRKLIFSNKAKIIKNMPVILVGLNSTVKISVPTTLLAIFPKYYNIPYLKDILCIINQLQQDAVSQIDDYKYIAIIKHFLKKIFVTYTITDTTIRLSQINQQKLSMHCQFMNLPMDILPL